MKCAIIFFSQSGNTKKMAYAIQKGMSGVAELCDVSRLDRVDVAGLAKYDLIGIGSPVWAGVPPHVTRFMSTLPTLAGKHGFTFCTHGAKPERFTPSMVRLMLRKGFVVIGNRGWYASVIHPCIPKPYHTDGHPDDIDIEEVQDYGRQMVETSRRVAAGETTLIPPVPSMPGPRVSKPLPTPMKLHKERCRFPECRLCMDYCRMGLIDLSVSPPIYPKRGCKTCYFCEFICPTGAIEIDYGPRAGQEVEHAKGAFLEALTKAEAEGRFRRLVPLDNVGWETPYYTVCERHPRYVIPEEDR